MIDLNVLENLTDYFLDDEFWSEKTYQGEEEEYQMGSMGVDDWFFSEKNRAIFQEGLVIIEALILLG